MKKTKIIVPALGLLLLSTAASVTGTVAWFSANTSVDVNGMTVTTKVSGNLLIADHNVAGTGEQVDSMYSASDYEVEDLEGLLEPVSTTDGNHFFYNKVDVKGDGSIDNTSDDFEAFKVYEDTTDGKSAFSKYYFGDASTENAQGYIDYEFYLKATSTADKDEIFISKCNLLYNGDVLGQQEDANENKLIDNAWRIAVFAEPIAQNTAATNVGQSASALKTIMSVNNAAYFDTGKAISAADGTKASVTNLNEPALLGVIDGVGATQRFHVIIRLWLEGEDKSCTNETFALLTSAYTLDITCGLKASGSETIPTVTNIDSVKASAQF